MRTLVILVVFLFSAKAWAKTETARMVELDKDGQVIHNLIVPSVTLSSRKINLREIYGTKCPPGAFCILGYWEKSRDFFVHRKTVDKCGSRHYKAVWADRKSWAQMELIDHSTRVCKDLRRYRWDVRVTEIDRSQRYFGGTPGVDPTKPDCSEVTKDVMCTMQYMPATCSIKLSEELISASGGNPCQATAELRRVACEKGLDWENLDEDKVMCSVQIEMPCPSFMCIDPGPGCELIPNNQVDERGCHTSCGDIVCRGGPDIAPAN